MQAIRFVIHLNARWTGTLQATSAGGLPRKIQNETVP